MEKAKIPDGKKPASAGGVPQGGIKSPPPPQPRLQPLFRRIDWLTLVITFVFAYVAYFLTIAPELTLEDSGELAVGSLYAGIPHPPGYPVWTMFTWLWTLNPVGNVAWRVGLASAFAGALGSGLLAFVVSRGSSMIIESIDELKNINRRWENAICMVSGFVAGSLIAFNGFMWSQAVIVEVYPLSVVSLMGVVVCLLRWTYAPHQHRYLFWAFFLYGICFNNHQSLLVIAMSMEVLILVAEPKMGRELFFWNTIIFLGGWVIKPDVLWSNTPVKVIYFIIGIASAAIWVWQMFKTKITAIELGRDVAMLGVLGCAVILLLGITHYLPSFSETPTLILISFVGLGLGITFVWLIKQTKKYSKEWLIALGCGGSWLVGAAFYLYEPIAGMTCPPMQWAYPRTVDGFIAAMTRGQYEKIHPTSGANIFDFFSIYGQQLWIHLVRGLTNEFNIIFLLIALVVFLFYRKMKRRERSWIIGMVAFYICLGPFLTVLLNPAPDRQAISLNMVFFTAGHVFVAMSVGYGLTLIAASMAARYESLRKFLILGGICAVDLALFTLAVNSLTLLGDLSASAALTYGIIKIVCWLFAATGVILTWRKELEHERLLTVGIPGLFVLVSFCVTIATILENKLSLQGFFTFAHAVVKSFGPAQYGLPVHAALILLAAGLAFLCCAWMFRSKAPLGITLLLFALIPSYSILTHWTDNEQRQHWFGYWFGHDMFTPPFVAMDGKFSYDAQLRERAMKGTNGNLVYPEMTRDAILFGGTDPGRFCPTYMIFCDSFIPHNCQPVQDQQFDRRDVYIITQNALADAHYLEYIRSHYFRSDQYKYDFPFFQEVLRGPAEHNVDSRYYETTNILARAAYKTLDEPLTKLGARIEARRRREGVYPPIEIYTPTQEDSSRCFNEYSADFSRRASMNPPQLKPGENANVDRVTGRMQINGQVAVMSINGLLTKVIFDHNPTNEFFLEESFPLEWMYDYLTPFGIIMKINREPVPEITEEMVRRDHEFWSKYSERFVGNWITYDTSVKEITDFVEKVYLHRDYNGFKGDRKFIRDDDAQKSFSKLRSSIGASVYGRRVEDLWLKLSNPQGKSPQELQQLQAVYQRMLKEADFAFRQSFAFCPYSPEAVYHYVNLLVTKYNRIDDALLIAETCHKLDPYNAQIKGLVDQLRGARNHSAPVPGAQIQNEIRALENEVRANPTNFQKAFDLAARYLQTQQPARAAQILDQVLNDPHADTQAVFTVARAYADMKNYPKLETALEKLVKMAPGEPEMWYDLASVKATLNKPSDALQALRQSLDLSAKRLQKDPGARNMRSDALVNPGFDSLHDLPEFKAITAPR